MKPTSLLVGIGSPHGDDRLGWEVAERVAQRAGNSLVVRCLRTPAALFDLLDGIDTLEICDAVSIAPPAEAVYCWTWPTLEIERVAFRGSHDLSLPAVLEIAEQLGQLPGCVRIWGVPIETSEAGECLSLQTWAAVHLAVDRICGALVHA